jgi:hypothetical protein
MTMVRRVGVLFDGEKFCIGNITYCATSTFHTNLRLCKVVAHKVNGQWRKCTSETAVWIRLTHKVL